MILFSDMLGGFDLVLKIKDIHIINNKQSAWISSIDGLQDNPDFDACDTLLSIGHIQLTYYDSSLKKTGRFPVLTEHRNLKMYNYHHLQVGGRRVVKVGETLEMRLNREVYRRVAGMWRYMTQQAPQAASGGPNKGGMVKFETEIGLSNVQLQIISEEKLLYMCDINGFKLTLSHFASVFK